MRLTRSTRCASRSIPLAPRPAFAAALRRRIVAELGPTREEHTMPDARSP